MRRSLVTQHYTDTNFSPRFRVSSWHCSTQVQYIFGASNVLLQHLSVLENREGHWMYIVYCLPYTVLREDTQPPLLTLTSSLTES